MIKFNIKEHEFKELKKYGKLTEIANDYIAVEDYSGDLLFYIDKKDCSMHIMTLTKSARVKNEFLQVFGDLVKDGLIIEGQANERKRISLKDISKELETKERLIILCRDFESFQTVLKVATDLGFIEKSLIWISLYKMIFDESKGGLALIFNTIKHKLEWDSAGGFEDVGVEIENENN